MFFHLIIRIIGPKNKRKWPKSEYLDVVIVVRFRYFVVRFRYLI